MKTLLTTLALTLASQLVSAQSVPLKDYNWASDDIATKGITKEKLFASMDRSLVKLGDSICSNRALLWLNDFKRHHDIDGSKIFLFYTGKTGEAGAKTWWYHVSPLIAENGVEWVMDAGFSYNIKRPMSPQEWLKTFTGSTNCKEISANETDLIERMFKGQVFPENTKYGSYDCYYKKVPAGYWTPASVAMNLLGRDSSGRTTTFERPEINQNEVYAACKEAVTGPLGYALGSGARKCKKYLGLE